MIYKTKFRAMGCQMLAALDSRTNRAAQWLESVPEWFERWEAVLSRFRPESELYQLNTFPEFNQPVSETLWSVFEAAIEAERKSSGLVTPTVLEALVSAGYNESFDSLSRTQYGHTGTNLHSFSLADVEWSPTSHTIRLPAGLRLDFGGIAKGWAAHQAMLRLQACSPALVNAGGDIAISGPQLDGKPWPVDIADPFKPGASLGLLLLDRCGVATSGRDHRRWQQNDAWRHHIIDPRTGLPADTDVISATVIAPTVLYAETAAKSALILGSQAGLDWLEARPTLAGLLVLDDGRLIYSSRFKKYLWS
jgi:thiamine biosynthesis lipoprotein